MSQNTLSVTVVDSVSKPLELVRQEMIDMAFHETGIVHPNVKFTVLAKDAEITRFRQEAKILGGSHVNEIISRETGDGAVIQDFISGPNKGAHVTIAFQPDGNQSTRVGITIDLPLKGLRKLLLPLLRSVVAKGASKALREDMQCLENGSYEDFLARSRKSPAQQQ
ncbi:MAG TPA: hypothetical protein VF747_06500 [Blastocatellia bacterium]|jgi:hypothetical protein